MNKNSKKCLVVFGPLRISEDPQSFKGKGPGDPFHLFLISKPARHGQTKSTLITYFSGMKIDPKYAFLHAFSFICQSYPFQNLYDQKHTLFSNFARFCTPKWCTHVQCLVLKNNRNYVSFWTSLIPLWHSSAPPGLEAPSNVSSSWSCTRFMLCRTLDPG